jgi:hypothetical protein
VFFGSLRTAGVLWSRFVGQPFSIPDYRHFSATWHQGNCFWILDEMGAAAYSKKSGQHLYADRFGSTG